MENVTVTPHNEIIRDNWQKIKEHIRVEYRLSNASYKTWIEKLEIADIQNNLVRIRIPNGKPMMLTYITENYQVLFMITISELLGEDYEVEFVLDDVRTDPAVPVPAPDAQVNRVMLENAHLNPRYNFDTFIVGSNNYFAQSACLAVAESPGNTYNPLFLYGGSGLGKTHLMQSIGNYILEVSPHTRVLYVTSEQFTTDAIESIRSGNASSMARVRDKYRTVDVLLLDDIQFILGQESTQEEFVHTFNELHQSGNQIVISSDRPPKEMETLDERFRSRFEWGLIADIQPPSYETRMAILRKNVESTGATFGNDVLEYIATNIKSNVRELEGAVNKIIMFSKLNNVELNLENAREALKDMVYHDKGGQITPDRIMSAVCEHYGVRTASILSKKKDNEIVVPRHVIMYLLRTYTDMTLKDIARFIGRKDHSTVIHGVENIKENLVNNEEMQGNINIILRKLGLPG